MFIYAISTFGVGGCISMYNMTFLRVVVGILCGSGSCGVFKVVCVELLTSGLTETEH